MAEATVTPEGAEQQEAAAGKAPKAKREKKEKPPKAPKEKKEKKGKRGKKAGEEEGEEPVKERRGFPKILFLIAFLVALLLVAGAFYYFNLFSVRSIVLNAANNALASLDPEYRHYNAMLSERENALNARENELRQQEEALTREDDRLQRRSVALDAREKALAEEQLHPTPLFRKEITEEKLAELKNLGKIYSSMDAKDAAQALSLLSGPIEIAEVLFYMDKNAAADVLAALKPELAAQITREMLRE